MLPVSFAKPRLCLPPVRASASLALLRTMQAKIARFSSAQREAILTGAIITAVFLAIIHFELGAKAFVLVEHRSDYKRDGLILAGLTLSLGLAVFAMRRWQELSREINFRIAAEARANALAREDSLTGLPNRRALASELARAVAASERSGRPVSLLLMDLDRFKAVNDVYGHMAGDRLLQEITARLRQTVRTGEFVARLGGDEFALIVVHDGDDRKAPLTVADRINAAVSKAVALGTAEVHVGVSTGIATFPFDADDVTSLMRRADVALYRAKDGGRGGCKLFDASMDAAIQERADIEADLRLAISSGQVVPHFQPLVDLRSCQIVGFEALARWEHPKRGFVPPASFVPIAEECGLIDELGASILTQACQHAAQWAPEIMLSVNISPLQLADHGLGDKILKILKDADFPAHRLEIEITENALVSDVDGARAILSQLKAEGVSVSLDDFGAGYSSLRHLSSMPFDRVKIDRDFVPKGAETGEPVRVLRAIVGLCTNLGLATTGEGAETVEHAALLLAAGCSVGQGWYFGRPMPAAQALAWASGSRPANGPCKSAMAAAVEQLTRFRQFPPASDCPAQS